MPPICLQLRRCLVAAIASLTPGFVHAQFIQPARLLSAEPFGAEDPHSEDDVPRVPEPMVFDLVRPLGARQGELEVNTLAIVPLRRLRGSPLPGPDAFERQTGISWAPEVEYALFDNFAMEFELPCEDAEVEAYKTAAQYTFGTSLGGSYIHGVQAMFEQVLEPSVSEYSMLYLAGIQFDERWSALAMVGFRTFMGQVESDERIAALMNFSVFCHLTDYITAGLESNRTTLTTGIGTWLIMPQVHLEITDHIMLQAGCGVEFFEDKALPLGGLRGIYAF